MLEAKRMTFFEYSLRMKACELKMLDEQYMCYVQAWANRAAEAQDKSGKRFAFKTIKDAFDYEKAEKDIMGVKRKKRLSREAIENIKAAAKLNGKGGVRNG